MDTTGTTAAGRRIGALSAHVSEPAAPLTAAPTAAATRPRLKIAAVVTEYRRYSHAQHICDRFLIGYGWENRHHKPECDLVALYVDQHDEATHLSDKRCAEFPIMKKYPTIREALCLGGDTLAVDGVLLIGEHGSYPKNVLGMTLYPCAPCPHHHHPPARNYAPRSPAALLRAGGTSSSRRSWRSSAAPTPSAPSSTTSTSAGATTSPRRWSTQPTSSTSPSSQARLCPVSTATVCGHAVV